MKLLQKFKIMKEEMELSIRIHKLRKELNKLRKEEISTKEDMELLLKFEIMKEDMELFLR